MWELSKVGRGNAMGRCSWVSQGGRSLELLLDVSDCACLNFKIFIASSTYQTFWYLFLFACILSSPSAKYQFFHHLPITHYNNLDGRSIWFHQQHSYRNNDHGGSRSASSYCASNRTLPAHFSEIELRCLMKCHNLIGPP